MSAMANASKELARLDGMLEFIDPEMLSMLVGNLSLRESVSSSSIEGTRSTVDDVLRSEKVEERNASLSGDNQEIISYRRALLMGFENLQVGGRMTLDLIRDLHRILMEGVGGSDKSPGEFKTRQNAIGLISDTLETAKIVPASPESVDFLLDNWLEYVNSDDVDTLEKVAISHYQFEAIHPFRDGNGRIGRLLMLMILRRDGLLKRPILFMSGYLDLNRDRYIDLMYRVSTDDAIDDWLEFMSTCLVDQSRSTAATVGSLIRYRDILRDSVTDFNESRLVDLLFVNPYVNSKDLVDRLRVSLPTANKMLARFESMGIIREVTGKKRNRLYLAEGVMEIIR